jgi:HEAT repeat protein
VASYDPLALDGAPLPQLLDLLDGRNPAERADAACAIGDRLRTREMTALAPDAQERLARLLGDEESAVRFEAAIALALVQDARATEELLGCLRSRRLRLDAIRALGTGGAQRAIEPLTRLMQRRLLPWADRLQAAAALCALGDPAGAEHLKTRLLSRRHAERAAAVHFIGESRHPEARTLLEGLLADKNHPLRDVAARALGLLGDPAAGPALTKARADADTELQADIDQALADIRRVEPA